MKRFSRISAAWSAAVAAVLLVGVTAVPANAAVASAGTITAAVAKRAGCPATGSPVPESADAARIKDVDHDGEADVEFYEPTEAGPRFGIRTASGATHSFSAGLAAPSGVSGWTAVFPHHQVLAVVSSIRIGALKAFVDCRWVTVKGPDGKPFQFSINDSSPYGTGVECIHVHGERTLAGVLATRHGNGRYSLAFTDVHVSKNGRTATIGATHRRAGTFSRNSPQVRHAFTSGCSTTPVVTSGD